MARTEKWKQEERQERGEDSEKESREHACLCIGVPPHAYFVVEEYPGNEGYGVKD
jgi:hypothetical protein